jgi:hypothetical protein
MEVTMGEQMERLQDFLMKLDEIQMNLEDVGRLGEALTAYEALEKELNKEGLMPFHSQYRDGQRVMAVCLQRQGAILALLNRLQQLVDVRKRQLAAGRASGDLLTLAGGLCDYGAALLVAKIVDRREEALHALEEARRLYESGEEDKLRLGLVDFWVQVADLQLDGFLPGGSVEALRSADRALAISKTVGDGEAVAKANSVQVRANEAQSSVRKNLGVSNEGE